MSLLPVFVSSRAAAPTPVVVELFTSEGCSDCPAADAMLANLVSAMPRGDGAEIIALSEHVDYWDRLGWRDRFSSAAFTARQQVYSAQFNLESIYTPQMVVDGAAEFVGSDANAARRAIAKAVAAPHGTVSIDVQPDVARPALHIGITGADLPKIGRGDRADIVVAVTEDGLKTDVKRGENQGRSLSHAAVVRWMSTIGEVGDGGVASAQAVIALDPQWQKDHLKMIAFVQERRGRRILASAAAPMQTRR